MILRKDQDGFVEMRVPERLAGLRHLRTDRDDLSEGPRWLCGDACSRKVSRASACGRIKMILRKDQDGFVEMHVPERLAGLWYLRTDQDDPSDGSR